MSRIQTVYEIQETYQRFDADCNGQIDLGEFRALLQELGAGLEPSKVEAVFDAIDMDENGLIDYGEFSQWWEASCL
jgi:Ca2+-binding EF-hand superfamily protein